MDTKKKKINIKTCNEELNYLLKKSIKLRTFCDVDYALYFSKGVDSSLISTFHNFKSKIYFNDTFNWKGNFFKEIKKIIYHLDFPVGSYSSYPLWKLAETAKKKKIKVVISGEELMKFLEDILDTCLFTLHGSTKAKF